MVQFFLYICGNKNLGARLKVRGECGAPSVKSGDKEASNSAVSVPRRQGEKKRTVC